ncbi:MAG: hypothetical protein JO071_13950 [Deltaproteobacteria bacterium]|nr:hypothetical protein [Deltaproteobacteria bacterium]
MNTAPQPRELSPRFRIILGGVLFIGVAIFFLALHHPHGDRLMEIKETRDGWWMHQQQPTPRPTPRVQPTPVLRPIIVQQPPRATPHPQPTICQICLERMMRYEKAIETGMGANGDRTRELPQAINPNAVPTPPLNIFAYEPVQR